MKLVISEDAQNDIIEIYNYIARDSIQYAKQTANNIYSRIAELEDSPYIGRYVQEFSNKQYKELIYKSYRIFYEIFEETSSIYIYSVVHSRRDFKSFYIKNNF